MTTKKVSYENELSLSLPRRAALSIILYLSHAELEYPQRYHSSPNLRKLSPATDGTNAFDAGGIFAFRIDRIRLPYCVNNIFPNNNRAFI